METKRKEITLEVLIDCIRRMTSVIPFFPQTELGIRIVCEQILLKTDRDQDKILWLTEQAIEHLRAWEGIPGLTDLLAAYRAPGVDGAKH